MESDAENKRKGLLALGLLGLLLVVVLTVFTLFDGDESDTDNAGGAQPTASQGAAGDASGGGDAGNDSGGTSLILSRSEVAEAHDAMTTYMAGITTYDYTATSGSWARPLLRLTTGDTAMKQETALPTGKEWAACKAAKCVSKGTASVVRDALISDDVTRGSGKTISSVVSVTAERTENGRTTKETNSWLVSAKMNGGQWRVSGFDLFGLGNVGASDQTGE